MSAPFTTPKAFYSLTRKGVLPNHELFLHIEGWTMDDCLLMEGIILQNETSFGSILHVEISGIDSLAGFNTIASVIGMVTGPNLKRVSLSFTDRIDFLESNESKDDLKGFKRLFRRIEHLQTFALVGGNWNAEAFEDLVKHLIDSDPCANKLFTVTSLSLKMAMSESMVAILEDFVNGCSSLETLILDAGADRNICSSLATLLVDLRSKGCLSHLGEKQLTLENGGYPDASIAKLEHLFALALNVSNNFDTGEGPCHEHDY